MLSPFLALLHAITSFLLALVGISGAADHDGPNRQEAIQALLREAQHSREFDSERAIR